MTTIAWDGTSLAADRAASGEACTFVSGPKISKTKDGRLIGVAGDAAAAVRFRDWLSACRVDRWSPPDFQKDKEDYVVALEVLPSGHVIVHQRLGSFELAATRHAIGSGQQFALGAMAAGATAADAVRIASELDPWSGKGVDVLTLGSPC